MAGLALLPVEIIAHRDLDNLAHVAAFLCRRRLEIAIDLLFQLCSNFDFHGFFRAGSTGFEFNPRDEHFHEREAAVLVNHQLTICGHLLERFSFEVEIFPVV